MIYQPPFFGENKYLVSTHYTEFPYHWHKEIEVLWCVQGSVSVHIEGKEYRLETGEGVFINSAEEHSISSFKDNGKLLVIEVGEALLGKRFSLFLDHVYPVHRLPLEGGEDWQNEIRRLLSGLLREYPSGHMSEGRLLVRGYLYELTGLLYRHLPMIDVDNEKQKKQLMYLMNIQPALDYTEHNFGNQITVGMAANAANYERTSFCRVFRMATGVTFLQYLNSRRIDEAKMLLRGSALSIQEIGERCGMPRAKTFIRVFRQYCGMTPSDYRRGHG